MTADSLMVNGLYNNPYLMSGYNPTFNAAATTATQNTAVANESLMDGSIQRAPEEAESGSNWKAYALIGTGVLALGATCLISRGKKAGAEGWKKQIVEGFKSLGGSGEKVIFDKTKNLVIVPGQANKITASTANYADEMTRLGSSVSAPTPAILDDAGKNVLEKGVRVQSGSFKHNNNIIEYENGKVTKYLNDKGDDILNLYTNPSHQDHHTYKATLDDIIAKLSRGEYPEGIDNLTINQFTHLQDDILRTFKANGTGYDFVEALTNKFHIDSEALKTLTCLNERVKDAIVKIKKGDYKYVAEKMQKATYAPSGKDFRFNLENGKIINVERNGYLYEPNSVGYKDLYNDNKKIFDNIFDNTEKFEGVMAVL